MLSVLACLLACRPVASALAPPPAGSIVSRRTCLLAPLVALAPRPALSAVAPRDESRDFASVSTQTPLPAKMPADGKASPFVERPSGLKYKEVEYGSGETARPGDTVAVQFTGRLLNLNGKKFYSTLDSAKALGGLPEPYVFTIGDASGAIPGLQELVVGMGRGGVRRGVLPPNLGYDSQMRLGPSPTDFADARSLAGVVQNPNRDATLVVDVQLERVRRK